MVLQNKIQMRHICYQVNEEHTISRLLQEVPFQINTHRYAETSSAVTQLQSRCSVPTSASAAYIWAVDLQQSFKKGGNFDSNQTCLHSLSISLSSFRWQFGSSENLYFSYWQCFQWSGPLPKNPRLSFLPWALFPSHYWPPPSLTLISRPCSFLISSLFIVLATSSCLSHPVWRIRHHRRVPFSAPLYSLKNFP